LQRQGLKAGAQCRVRGGLPWSYLGLTLVSPCSYQGSYFWSYLVLLVLTLFSLGRGRLHPRLLYCIQPRVHMYIPRIYPAQESSAIHARDLVGICGSSRGLPSANPFQIRFFDSCFGINTLKSYHFREDPPALRVCQLHVEPGRVLPLVEAQAVEQALSPPELPAHVEAALVADRPEQHLHWGGGGGGRGFKGG
jgi:hypothetical protein